MSVTRLKRKGKRNKAVAKNRVNTIKRLNIKPTIKNVDVEEMKQGFEATPAPTKKAKKAAKEEAPVVEAAAPAESTDTAETTAE